MPRGQYSDFTQFRELVLGVQEFGHEMGGEEGRKDAALFSFEGLRSMSGLPS